MSSSRKIASLVSTGGKKNTEKLIHIQRNIHKHSFRNISCMLNINRPIKWFKYLMKSVKLFFFINTCTLQCYKILSKHNLENYNDHMNKYSYLSLEER